MVISLIRRFAGRAGLIALLMTIAAVAAQPTATADAGTPRADVSLEDTMCSGTNLAAVGLAVTVPELGGNLIEACQPPPYPDRGCICNTCLGNGRCTCCSTVDGIKQCYVKGCNWCK